MKKPTQKERIELHIRYHRTITTMEAFSLYKITRLAQYIMLLRKSGMNIESVQSGKGYVIYTLR